MKELPPSARDEIHPKDSNDTISETVETSPTAAGARITPASGYCQKCSKIAWNSREKAEKEVQRIKARPDARKPHLIDAYPCPYGNAFHVGHNFKLLYEFRNQPEGRSAVQEEKETN